MEGLQIEVKQQRCDLTSYQTGLPIPGFAYLKSF